MKIICVGMNYTDHLPELQEPPTPTTTPVLFLKPESALLRAGNPFFVPDFAQRFDYEAELCIRISQQGRHIAPQYAHRYYDAVTVGIDFTARDLQNQLRAQGQPWEISKAFDGSAAIGQWQPLPPDHHTTNPDHHTAEPVPEPTATLHFRLDIDGHTVQRGQASQMTHPVSHIIATASQYFTLKSGDIIMTGTPAGIGPVHPGQILQAYLQDQPVLHLKIK